MIFEGKYGSIVTETNTYPQIKRSNCYILDLQKNSIHERLKVPPAGRLNTSGIFYDMPTRNAKDQRTIHMLMQHHQTSQQIVQFMTFNSNTETVYHRLTQEGKILFLSNIIYGIFTQCFILSDYNRIFVALIDIWASTSNGTSKGGIFDHSEALLLPKNVEDEYTEF